MATLTQLSREQLGAAIDTAEGKLEELLSRPSMQFIAIGRNMGGWRTDLYEGRSFESSSDSYLGDPPEYVVLPIVFRLDPDSGKRVPCSSHYPALKEVVNYLAAEQILKENKVNRSAFVPSVLGHLAIDSLPERNRYVEGIVIEYVPLLAADSSLSPGEVEEYLVHLGHDVARFLVSGMSNVPRHLRPHYNGDSFRTAMIDLDPYDGQVFHWNLSPSTRMEQLRVEDSESAFIKNTFAYFVPEDYFLRKELRSLRRMLRDAYISSLQEEVVRLLGSAYLSKYVDIVR